MSPAAVCRSPPNHGRSVTTHSELILIGMPTTISHHSGGGMAGRNDSGSTWRTHVLKQTTFPRTNSDH